MSDISIHSVLTDPLHTSSPITPRQSGNKTKKIQAVVINTQCVKNKDRQAGQTGGGVMIAVRNNLLSSACPDLDTNCELVWANIELLGARNLYVEAYYRPPSANNTLLGLEQSLQKLRNSNSAVWLGGDFNLPNIDWEDNTVKPEIQKRSLGNSLLDICSDMGLTQMNNHPTRKENILDLSFTNNTTLVRHKEMLPGIGNHDSAIKVDSMIKPMVCQCNPRRIYQYHKGDMRAIKSDLKDCRIHSWQIVMENRWKNHGCRFIPNDDTARETHPI